MGDLSEAARGRYETFLDDPSWTTAEDGSRSAMFLLGSDPDAPAVAGYQVPSSYRFEPHFHRSAYLTVILRGSMRVGRRWYQEGDIRVQEEGSVYGPEEAGRDGCTMLNVFAKRRGLAPCLLPTGDYVIDPYSVPLDVVAGNVWNPVNEQAIHSSAEPAHPSSTTTLDASRPVRSSASRGHTSHLPQEEC